MSYLELTILAILSKKDRHGYEIKKVVDNVFAGIITINNNSLYTYLHRFERTGAVKSETRRVDGKPDRLVYSLTDTGRKLFEDLVTDYSPAIARSDIEFYARVAFFGMLEPGERLRILGIRRAALRETIRLYGEFGQSRRLDTAGGFDGRLLQHLIRQAEDEVAWVESIEEYCKEPEDHGTKR